MQYGRLRRESCNKKITLRLVVCTYRPFLQIPEDHKRRQKFRVFCITHATAFAESRDTVPLVGWPVKKENEHHFC